MNYGKANLTFYIFEGLLTGTLNGNHVNIFAYSGGGGMSKKRITDPSVVNSPYHTGKKQDYSGRENASTEKRGGPIPPGRYRIGKPVPWGQSKKAVLEPIGGTIHTLAAFNRGGFLIHGQGILGSDGCIVPTSADAFRKLIEGLEADGGGILWVCESLGGDRFA